ncbi:NADH:ubiquinone oxidoreductase [Coemansia biformis]|uniref:NADH:ubiquinone oxidoreductase n=1 Tax=Coemansia biformis TaxID=1286918 RepID=A0A9W7Y3J7_9FUNG|nr:NADH:ubiquinone oxidoreductase [Coemansia biformis]
MSEEEPVNFASSQEELAYWRNASYALRDQLENKEVELAEYMAESSELEAELESEIKRVEAANAELRAKNERYKFEIAELKEKYQSAQLKAGEDLESIERELQFVRSQQEYYKSRTRELEQDNDDLERNERAAKSTLQAMETRLSRAMEENSHLLGEAETKKMLADEVQRLKDELKDLNLELNIVRSRNSRAVPQSAGMSKSSANVVDAGNGENPARMVHDIMSRVKDLETRLAGTRTKVTPMIIANNQSATLNARSTRNRTISTPKSSSLFVSGATSSTGDSLQRPTALRSRGISRPPESMIPSSSLLESRMEKTRILRESFRKTMDETVRQQQQQQHAMPLRRPAV